MKPPLEMLSIQIYADGADLETMIRLNADPLIKGLTTNPTLMKKSGVTDYEGFALRVLEHVTTKPISFEVFSDDADEMIRQAKRLSSWAKNVFVKIPVINSRGEPSYSIIRELSMEGVKVNVTAVMNRQQALWAAESMHPQVGIISIFCGRIADTMRYPIAPPAVMGAEAYLWASTREVFNINQAEALGYDIITVPAPILEKAREMQGRDLDTLCLETVQMFKRDSSGYVL